MGAEQDPEAVGELSVFNEKKSLTGILLLGLVLRLKGLFSPILDLYPMRQEQCAMLARNFFRHGLNILNGQVDWFGNYNSSWSLELPLISYLAAALYRVFGLHEFLGRLVAIAFSLGSIYLFHRLVRLFFDQKIGLFSTFVFAVSPLAVYFGRAFMPEALMMFFTLGGLYYFVRFLDNENWVDFLLAVLFSSLAILSKATSIYLLFPVLFLGAVKYRWGILKKWKIGLLVVLSVLPAVWWYSRSNILLSSNIRSLSAVFGYLTMKEFYLKMLERIGIFVFTPAGIILFIVGFFKKVDDPRHYFFYGWFLILVLYVIRLPQFHHTHYYYQLPFVPVASVFIGRALGLISERGFRDKLIFCRLNQRPAVTIIMVIILVTSSLVIHPFYNWNRITYRVGRFIDANTPRDSLLIAGRCTQEAPLYYADRKGWEINEEGGLSYGYTYRDKDGDFTRVTDEIELIELLISRGADYYFSTNLRALRLNPALEPYLRSQFAVVKEGPGYVIFDLNKR